MPDKTPSWDETKPIYDTSLNPEQEQGFRKWTVEKFGKGKPVADVDALVKNQTSDYDLRGAYLESQQHGDLQDKETGHFPDTYKKPGHPTFSTQSKYSTPENMGGTWEGNTYTPSASQIDTPEKKQKLIDYFKTNEGAKLNIPQASSGVPKWEDTTPVSNQPPPKWEDTQPVGTPLETNYMKLLPKELHEYVVSDVENYGKGIVAGAVPFGLGEKMVGKPEGLAGQIGTGVGNLASFIVPGAAATKITKIPALVNSLSKIAAIPKYGKYMSAAVEQLVSTGTTFGLQSQIQAPLATSVKDRLKALGDSELQATLFAGAGLLGGIAGKVGKTLSYPAMFMIGYNTSGKDASLAEKVINGLVLTGLHAMSSGKTKEEAAKIATDTLKERTGMADQKIQDIEAELLKSPEYQAIMEKADKQINLPPITAAELAAKPPDTGLPPLTEVPSEQPLAPARSTQTTQVQRESVLPKLEASGGGVISETAKPSIVSTATINDSGVYSRVDKDNPSAPHPADVPEKQRGFIVQEPDGTTRFERDRAKAAEIAKGAGQTDADTTELHSQNLRVGPGAATAESTEFFDATGTKNEYTKEMQKRLGWETDEQPSKSDVETLEQSRRILANDPYVGDKLVRELKSKPRPTTDAERLVLLHENVVAENALNNAVAEGHAVSPDDYAATVESNLKITAASERLQELFDIEQSASREWGRAGRAMQKMMNEDFSLARLTVRKQASTGKPLTPEQRAEVERTAEEYKKTIAALNERLAKKEEEHATRKSTQEETEDQSAIKDLEQKAKAKTSGERKSGKEPDIEGDKEKAIANITDAVESGEQPTISDLHDPIQKLALYLEQKDIDLHKKSTLGFREIINGVHAFVKRIIPTATYEQIRDTLSGYGLTRFPSKDAAKTALRRHKSEILKVAPIETVQKNIAELRKNEADAKLEATKHTGYQRDQIEAKARELTKKLASAMKEQDRLMKEAGIEVGDPAKRLKSALDAKKTRLTNQIDDINRAIAEHKELVRNKGLPVDNDETKALEAERDKQMAAYKEIFPDEPMSDQERLDRAVKAADRSLADWNARVEDAKKGIFRTKEPGKPLPESEKLSNLNKEREVAKAEVKRLHELAFPKRTPEEIALASYKTRATNRIKVLQDKIASGDFAPTPKREPIKLDTEGMKLQAELNKIRQDYEDGLLKDRLAKRTMLQKVGDAFVKWERAFKLSSPVVFGKLFMAAMTRGVTTAAEEVIGGGYSALLPDIARKAAREGGLNVKAEAKSITEGFMQGLKDSVETIKTGKSILDKVYSGKHGLPPEASDFFGHLHAMMKAPIKRAEFVLSFEKQTANAIANGIDVTDPMVQTKIAVGAYKDANRSIFLQDNAVTDFYKTIVNMLEQSKKYPNAGQWSARALRFLLPIVKVPTNIVGETFQYTAGSVIGAEKLARAMYRGMETVTPEEAELILRNLKKGTLGIGLMLMGYFNPQAVGGYYQEKEKRKPGDVKAGGFRMFDVDIPRWMTHAPAWEAIQIGATIRRVKDQRVKKTGKEKGISEGLWAGFLGLTKEVPFIDQVFRIDKMFGSSEERKFFFGEMARNTLEPQLVQKVANMMDIDPKTGEVLKRKPTTMLQHIEQGVPGLRQNVPENRKANAMARMDASIRNRGKANVTLDTYQSQFSMLKDMVNPDTGKKYTEGDIYGIVENRTSTGGDPHWKAMSPTERKSAVEYLNQVIQARRREATEATPEPPPPDAMSIMREMRGTMTPKAREMFDLRERSSVYGK